MTSSLAADLLVLLHLAFIVFVVLGGLLVWRWWRMVFLHLPASVWGVLLEFNGWQCPLTPLEQQLRVAAGEAGYSGSFIAHYLLPVIYPAGLAPGFQMALGAGALLINLVIYGWLLLRKHPMLK
ncbi:MAG TPA: DUF2784 domain-containing protein [Gammaproteobacteria bacterium]|nr:DUF2784 domain-containing protein [Gammaproteobacteria bacterium]